MTDHSDISSGGEHHFTNKIVRVFLESNLALVLILLATAVGLAALGSRREKKIRRSLSPWQTCT